MFFMKYLYKYVCDISNQFRIFTKNHDYEALTIMYMPSGILLTTRCIILKWGIMLSDR